MTLPEDFVVLVYNKPGDEGCAYTLRLPDGREQVVGDGDERYWALANTIDSLFPIHRKAVFPMPGTSLDGGTVLASVFSGPDDSEALVLLLMSAQPYYRVVELDLASGDITYRSAHPNIVPAAREYEDRGGDY